MSKARLVITALFVDHQTRPRSPPATACTAPGSTSSRPATRPKARPRSSPGPDDPDHPTDTAGHGRAGPAAAQAAHRRRPGRRRRHHRLAPAPPPPHQPSVAGHHQPDPGPRRHRDPDPSKRPKSSYIRFEADQPNETWQSDFTHYRLATGSTEIITWLDDHARYALHVTAHRRVTGPIVLATFRQAADLHGYPASTLTDNGMVYTTRLSGGSLRAPAAATPSRPSCSGSASSRRTADPTTPPPAARSTIPADPEEVAARPTRPADHHRRTPDPPRPLPPRVQPAPPAPLPPAPSHPGHRLHRPAEGHPRQRPTTDTHDRVRHDKINKAGTVTLRVAGRLRHIGVGRTYAGTYVILLVQDLNVRVVNAATGELLRDLTIDPRRDYQPTGRPPGPTTEMTPDLQIAGPPVPMS